MAEKRPSSREQIKQIVAGIEDGIQRIFQSENYMDYLRTMSRFHTYSYKNTILIHMQMPTATQAISIQAGMSQVQTVCAIVHEITHAMLHDREHTRLTAVAGDETKEPPKPKDERTKEVEAESVSYTVCQYFGIETGANSLGYIATWSKDRSLPELKASLETISKTANALITRIDRHFAEICKERGIDLAAEQPEQAAMDAPAPELPDTPERFMEDMLDLMDRLYAAGLIKKNFPPENREHR